MISILTGCGGGGGTNSDMASVALEVEDAYYSSRIDRHAMSQEKLYQLAKSAFNKAGLDPLEVIRFKVTVSSDELDTPVVQEASAESSQIQILDLDPGSIDILIEAYNANDEVIRRQEILSVVVNAGVVTPIKTQLHTVPIILNIKENAVVLSSNFRVIGFGEPGSVLNVKTNADSGDIVLSQSVDNKALTLTPSLSTGLFEFFPDTVPKGRQEIQLLDTNTDQRFLRHITVVSVDERPGTRISSQGGHVSDITIGAPIGHRTGVHFPSIQNHLSQTDNITE